MEKNKGKTVVKADLVDRVYEKVGFTRQEAVEAVDILLNEIKVVLASGEDVRISGFAGFHLKNKKSRKILPKFRLVYSRIPS